MYRENEFDGITAKIPFQNWKTADNSRVVLSGKIADIV